MDTDRYGEVIPALVQVAEDAQYAEESWREGNLAQVKQHLVRAKECIRQVEKAVQDQLYRNLA